jgi:hypothetical protein
MHAAQTVFPMDFCAARASESVGGRPSISVQNRTRTLGSVSGEVSQMASLGLTRIAAAERQGSIHARAVSERAGRMDELVAILLKLM